MLVPDRADARARRCHDHLTTIERLDVMADQWQRVLLVTGVYVHLAAARLPLRELHLMAKPLQQRHSRPPDVWVQRVRQARHEERNPHELHHAPSAPRAEGPGRSARYRSLACRAKPLRPGLTASVLGVNISVRKRRCSALGAPWKTPGTRLTASQLPGPPRKTLMTVTFRPHRVAMSSGSDVRTVTGPGAAKAVALSIASIACR